MDNKIFDTEANPEREDAGYSVKFPLINKPAMSIKSRGMGVTKGSKDTPKKKRKQEAKSRKINRKK